MKPCVLAFFALLLVGANAWSENASPSDQVIKQLLDVTNARQLLDAVKEQLNSKITADRQALARGQTITSERQAVLDRANVRMQSAIDEFLDWDALLPMYMRLYRETFTEEELKGMLKFYKSAAGQALVKKMPLLTHNMLDEIQNSMKPASIKMIRIQQETALELKELPDH